MNGLFQESSHISIETALLARVSPHEHLAVQVGIGRVRVLSLASSNTKQPPVRIPCWYPFRDVDDDRSTTNLDVETWVLPTQTCFDRYSLSGVSSDDINAHECG